jgi:hypothetical protein
VQKHSGEKQTAQLIDRSGDIVSFRLAAYYECGLHGEVIAMFEGVHQARNEADNGGQESSSPRLFEAALKTLVPVPSLDQTQVTPRGAASSDAIVNIISNYGNFGGTKSRSAIGGAFQAAEKSGDMEAFSQGINKSLSEKTLEATYSISAYVAPNKEHTKDYIGVDLHKDSITDGMSLTIPEDKKPEPLKDAEIEPAAAKIAQIIGDQGGLGDKNQRHEIQSIFVSAVESGLDTKLAQQVDQALGKAGQSEFYLAERAQFKDSKGNLIPELVLHLDEVADSITVPKSSD